MIKFYELNEEKRIAVTADTGVFVRRDDGTVVMEGESFDFPEDFDFDRQSDYKLINGELVYDPMPKPEEPQKTETADDVLNVLLGVRE